MGLYRLQIQNCAIVSYYPFLGPRFVLETIRIFAGSFEGAVLYDNPDYESPNAKRRALKLAGKGKYIEKQLIKKVGDDYHLHRVLVNIVQHHFQALSHFRPVSRRRSRSRRCSLRSWRIQLER